MRRTVKTLFDGKLVTCDDSVEVKRHTLHEGTIKGHAYSVVSVNHRGYKPVAYGRWMEVVIDGEQVECITGTDLGALYVLLNALQDDTRSTREKLIEDLYSKRLDLLRKGEITTDIDREIVRQESS